MENSISKLIDPDIKITRGNKNEKTYINSNNDMDCIQDLKNYSTIQLNEEIKTSNKPFPLHTVNEIGDIPACAQEFSKLTDPLHIKKTCIEKVHEWNHLTVDDLYVNQILSGLTNQLFEVSIREDKRNENNLIRYSVLFRILGKDVNELYCPSFELEVYRTMSKYKIAPHLINTFPGGRIEEWLFGHPLSVEDLGNPSIIAGIAHLLGKFHTLCHKHPLPRHWEKVPCFYKRMEKWKKNVLSYLGSDKPPYDFNKYINECDNFINYIRNYTKTNNIGNCIVFCHNDLQENNIISTNKCLCLIDFEYSDYNYLAMDIANLFNETTIDYTVNTYPFYSIKKEKYISHENRRLFVSVYLNAYLNDSTLSSDEKIIKSLLDAIEVQTLACHLQWGLWSIIRGYQMKSYNEFDFFLYAKDRFDMYDEKKEYLISNNMIQNY